MKKLVIIPTYNERENVSRMISKVMSLFGGYDLLIVDDGSPDGTAAIVRGRQEEFPGRVHLIERSGKLGLGTAYIAGFRWALAHGYDLVYEMDCDFSHNPDDLVRLYRAAADGAAQQARLTHQHLGASPAGSGAVVGNDGAQHRIMVLFHLIEQGGENVVHGVLLSGVGYEGTDQSYIGPYSVFSDWL